MEDIHNWYRIIGLYVALHVILFLIEWYKYKHSPLNWYGFKKHGMYDISYFLVFLDIILVMCAIIGWAVWPIIKHQ